MECVLEIGSCLEVSCITPTKGSTFQSVSLKCTPIWLWVLTSDLCRQLDSFQTSCFRIILGVSRTDHVSNEEVYDRTGTVPLSQSVKARQIRFLGHCLQLPQGDLISKYALYHPTHGKPRPSGRKILFHEYAAKLINQEPPPPPPFLTKFVLWHRTAKLGSAWRSTADTTGNPHERLSRAERDRTFYALTYWKTFDYYLNVLFLLLFPF